MSVTQQPARRTPRGADLLSRLSPREQVDSSCLEPSQAQQIGQALHPWAPRAAALARQPNLKVPCISALWPGQVPQVLVGAALLRIEGEKVKMVV